MPSLDIFCLRIFIAFSRLSRTSTSTGFPNAFSMGRDVGTRSPGAGQAPATAGDSLGLVVLVEQRDREAVELGVRALRDDLVDDFVVGVTADPVCDQLAEQLTLFRLRRREHLHTSNVNHPAFIHRSTM